jgi:hypothetical protein
VIRIVMLLMTMLVWCAAPVWAATATRAQGVFASVDARDVTGCLHAFVSVNRDGSTTFLFYSLVNVCALIGTTSAGFAVENAAHDAISSRRRSKRSVRL